MMQDALQKYVFAIHMQFLLNMCSYKTEIMGLFVLQKLQKTLYLSSKEKQLFNLF